MKSFDNYRII